MSCVENETLFAYVSGLLEEKQTQTTRAHIAECAKCREILDQYRKLDRVLDEWKPLEPSPWFDARVRAAVGAGARTEPARVPFGVHWAPRWVLAALGVLLVSVSFILIRTHSPKGDAGTAVQQEVPKPNPSVATVASTPGPQAQLDEEELTLYEDLSVLEDYDLLANFDVLSEFPRGEKSVAN